MGLRKRDCKARWVHRSSWSVIYNGQDAACRVCLGTSRDDMCLPAASDVTIFPFELAASSFPPRCDEQTAYLFCTSAVRLSLARDGLRTVQSYSTITASIFPYTR